MKAAVPFPFLVGCPRSGTTLLRAMLDAHPDMAIPFESYFIVKLAKARADFERGPAFDTEAFLLDLSQRDRFLRWALPLGEVRAALEAVLASPHFIFRLERAPFEDADDIGTSRSRVLHFDVETDAPQVLRNRGGDRMIAVRDECRPHLHQQRLRHGGHHAARKARRAG